MKKIKLAISVISSVLFCSASHSMDLDFARDDGKDASEFPRAASHVISHISYNVCAGGKGFEIFDTKINATEDKRHTWGKRSLFMDQFLKGSGAADIYSFQEISAQQVIDIQESLSQNYSFVVLASHPSDLEAGTIRNTDENLEEIASWQTKNIGTALVGIAYNKDKFSIGSPMCFWLKENPWEIPIEKNTKEGDKGFGNTNTSRAVLGLDFTDNRTQDLFYIFNSHYPIAGGVSARKGCATTEMEQIKKITNGKPWIATGDRNMIGSNAEAQDVYQCFFNNTMNVKDYRDAGDHYGPGTSWIGFSTDKFKNPIQEDGTFKNKDTLCATFYCSGEANILKSVRSANLLGEFDVNSGDLLPNANKLKNPEMRITISDHAALVFHFTFEH